MSSASARRPVDCARRPASVFTSGRELGFSLEEIGTLLRLTERKDMSCEEVDRLARQQLAEVQSRIRQLQGMAQELTRTIESCVGQSCGECAILEALQRSQIPQPHAT
jgi:MerR family transcriptional regulator, mercuric resistance operon regulatory protein